MTKGVTMTVFSERMVAKTVQTFWAALQREEFITDAAQLAGTYRKKGTRWLTAASGVRPRRGRNLKGRCLSFTEREEIAVGRAAGESLRSIGSITMRCGGSCCGQWCSACCGHTWVVCSRSITILPSV